MATGMERAGRAEQTEGGGGTLPTGGAWADQARIAALEAQLADALRENGWLRRERERWAAEAQRLSAENARLRHAADARSRRRWP